jgi:PAS domain S-box-containing protein
MTEAEGALHQIRRGGSARAEPEERSIGKVDLYEALLRAQSDLGQGVAVGDMQTQHLLYANEAFCQISGYSPEELKGLESFFDLLEPDDVPPLLELMALRLQGHQTPEHYVVTLVRKDGSRTVIETAMKPIGSPTNTQFIAIVRDVTERQETLKELRQLNRDKDEFLAVVAHDLRTPLAVVSGFAETLLENWDAIPEDQKLHLLGRITQNARALAERVGQDLMTASVQSGRLRYDIAPFDLLSLIELTTLELEGTTTKGRFQIDVPTDLPPALGDQNRQKQILMNLLSNAIKFSTEDEPIRIAARQVDDMIEVRVTDRGLGVSAEDLELIFEKYTQLVQPRVSASGAGLGLFIARSMVGAQGGTMHAESERGVGTTLVYTIRVAGMREI